MPGDWVSGESAPAPWDGSGRALDSLPARLRPREKLLARGASCLGQAELVALVIGNGTARRPAAATADRLVRRHRLAGLAALTPQEWIKEPGIGPAMGARLAAAFELGRRAAAHAEPAERPAITRPRDAWLATRDLARAKKEHLVGLYLDAQNGLLHRETISVGSLNTTRTHPREILYPALVHLALGFILVHNHPSGSLDPSDEDVAFTRAVHRAGETVGIELYDHLIVAGPGFTSLRERGAF
jgi:DNA repair protein RadC